MRGFTGGIILKIFMGLIVLSFVVWGIGDFVQTSGGGNNAATVGGVGISNARLAEEVRRQTAHIRQMFGGQVPDEMMKAMNVESMILKQMVQEELLKQGAENAGLRVDDSVITKLIAGNPAFRDKDGKFDRERFKQTLWNMGQDEAGYIEGLKQNIAVMFLVQAITADSTAPKMKVSILHAIDGQKRVAEYVEILPSNVNVPEQPEPAALAAFYDAHKKDFALPESRKVSYVTFSKQDLGKDATAETLYALANKVEDALAGGASMEELAKNLNLKLKQIEKLEMLTPAKDLPDGEAFVQKAFGIEQGNESGLLLSQDQATYYVMRVDAIVPMAEQPLAKVQEKVVATWKAAELERLMKDKAEKIVQRLSKGEKLAAVSTAEGLNVQRSNPISRGKTESLPEEFVQQLFQASKGLVKGVYPLEAGGFVVGELASVIPATPLTEKEIATQQELMREGVFEDLLAQYTLYLQQKTPVKITTRATREAE
jgi:peptidyl-prolyl cis-trans isomerase D